MARPAVACVAFLLLGTEKCIADNPSICFLKDGVQHKYKSECDAARTDFKDADRTARDSGVSPPKQLAASLAASLAMPLCRFFNSKNGCRNGDRCRFQHEYI